MKNVIVEQEATWVSVKLNRAEKHNAMDAGMIAELTQTFRSMHHFKGARAIVLSGIGKSFCSGADLEYMKSMATFTETENRKDAEVLFDLFAAVSECPLPVIGRFHGNVFGGGLGLVACCDIGIAESATQFCFSEVKLGLIPAVISSFALRKMNRAAAMELMMTGKIFGTDEAKASGLLTYFGRELELSQYIENTLASFRGAGPEAVQEIKKLIRSFDGASSQTVRQNSVNAISERRVSAEGQEGLRAYLEKRKPVWAIK